MVCSNRSCRAISLFLALSVFGCAVTHAPREWLERPKALQADAYGGWIYVKTNAEEYLAGELIAISSDSVFVANETFHAIARSDIRSARLTAYESNAWRSGAIVALGTGMTISNGIACLATAPMWMIGGTIVTIIKSREPIIDYPDHGLGSFMPFARYPQGLPSMIDRKHITMKPGTRI
jgi:hypothetical protein